MRQSKTKIRRIKAGKPRHVEWPTLFLLLVCYAAWALTTLFVAQFSTFAAILVSTLLITLHSSLQHEVIHGHPLPSRRLSEVLVFPAIGLFIPYHRFRDLHLQHHYDPKLTDPYEDPESNYMDPAVWSRLSVVAKWLLRFNNSLLGRMLVGPMISQFTFMKADWKLFRDGDRQVALHWLLHFASVALVVWFVWFVSPLLMWEYLVAAYGGLSLLKIRTFLEHRAHDSPDGRTAVIADRGPLAFLFLNNNLHFVHHTHPAVPWYELPRMFEQNPSRYTDSNEGYIYRSYGQVFAKYLFHAKDPVPHPLWPSK